MEPEELGYMKGRLDAQDGALQRIEGKLDEAVKTSTQNATALTFIKVALGAAWAAILAMYWHIVGSSH